MVPFDIFVGICSGGLVFMVYFLVGFWRDDRQARNTHDSAAQMPGATVMTVRKTRRVPDFSRASTATEFLIEESERDLRPANVWRVFVNPTRVRAKRVR